MHHPHNRITASLRVRVLLAEFKIFFFFIIFFYQNLFFFLNQKFLFTKKRENFIYFANFYSRKRDFCVYFDTNCHQNRIKSNWNRWIVRVFVTWLLRLVRRLFADAIGFGCVFEAHVRRHWASSTNVRCLPMSIAILLHALVSDTFQHSTRLQCIDWIRFS